MSITMINNTQKPFVVVNKAIAMDKDLNMRDRGMMLTLMSFPPEWNFSIKGLEKIVPDGRDAISSSLQRLEEKRYLVRVQERDEKGKFADTKIYINPNPKENPMTGEPLTEIPFSAKPMTENPIQISNKEIKHKESTNKKSITQSADKFSETVEAVKEQINYDVVCDPETNKLRIITPLETERIQGFEDNWTQIMPERMRYFCMGNALVVPMITRMGSILDKIFDEEMDSAL